MDKITIYNLAKLVHMPETTVRRYIRLHNIMPAGGGKRKKLYDRKEANKLILIRQLYENGLTTEQIRKARGEQEDKTFPTTEQQLLLMQELLNEMNGKLDKAIKPKLLFWRKK